MSELKERPILFSAPMVRAILDGRKTQTRRVVKTPEKLPPVPFNFRYKGAALVREALGITDIYPIRCPYGAAGDRLWVRERHSFNDVHREAKNGAGWPRQWWVSIEYADGIERETLVDAKPKQTRERGEIGWRPSIHMPRWASRITLEVTGVRVERLQEISEADAAAEGVEPLDSEAHCDREEFDHSLCGNCGGRRLYTALGPNMGACPDTDCRECDTHAKRYRWLWESINGAESWAANPWVWVVEFKRVHV